MGENRKYRIELQKILDSVEFRGSSNYKNLLTFLVEQTLAGEIPTERDIAEKGLGKEDLDTSNDASTRVYIHNLRKKLASYYMNEGRFDEIKISIPKGQHYQASFTPLNKDKFNKSKTTAALILAAVLIIANVSFWIINSQRGLENILDDDNIIWKEFFEGEKPIMIVIGDYYLMRDHEGRYVRDYKINSNADFDSLINLQSAKFEKTGHTLLGKYAVWCFSEIARQLTAKGLQYEIKLSSNLAWEDLTKNNIVFIGSLKTLNLMKNFTNGLSSSYRINPNTIFFNDKANNTHSEYRAPKNPDTGYLKDYALVTKLPGPSGNKILLFSSTHDIGHISTVKYFTDKDFIDKLSTKFSKVNSNHFFEAIFEVQGFERTGFYPNLVEFREVDENYQISTP